MTNWRLKNSKWVWSRNTTITIRRQPHGAALKSHITIMRYQENKLSKVTSSVTIQNGWNNRISDGCVYAQIHRGLGMHLVAYSNHDTVLFLLIVPIKGRFVWDGIHCVYIYQRLHDFLTLLEYLGNLVRFSIYKGWNFPFLLGDILNIPLKGSI